MLAQLRGKIIIAVLIGLAVVVALGLFSDVRQVGDSFRHFNWAMIPAILGFTLLNYALRWLKWDYYLRKLAMGQGVSRGASGLLFTSGHGHGRHARQGRRGAQIVPAAHHERHTSCGLGTNCAGRAPDRRPGYAAADGPWG